MTDPILRTLYETSYAAMNLSSLLPATDICDQLRGVLIDQCTILSGMIEGQIFIEEDLNQLREVCCTISKQVEKLSAVQEQ